MMQLNHAQHVPLQSVIGQNRGELQPMKKRVLLRDKLRRDITSFVNKDDFCILIQFVHSTQILICNFLDL